MTDAVHMKDMVRQAAHLPVEAAGATAGAVAHATEHLKRGASSHAKLRRTPRGKPQQDVTEHHAGSNDSVFSLLAITLYILVGAVYYVPKLGLTGWEVIYFSICTVTTVG
jgi:hypothetical protein